MPWNVFPGEVPEVFFGESFFFNDEFVEAFEEFVVSLLIIEDIFYNLL